MVAVHVTGGHGHGEPELLLGKAFLEAERRASHIAVPDRVLAPVLLAAGAAILWLGWFGPLEDLAGVACRILGWYPLITSLIGWSPLYAVLGVSTRANGK